MNRPLSVAEQSRSAEQALGLLIEQLTAKLQAGAPVDIQPYLQQHPEHAERLRQLLPALHLLADLGRSASTPRPSTSAEPGPGDGVVGTLGDFRIIGEVGRGGMGIVYDAEQVSLGRRVALKVLPFGSALDARHLQRFKNEAQAAAQLHHPNIVPVYGVGCERGVHYYAMQFIEGQSLGALIRRMRFLEKRDRPDDSAAIRAPGPASTADPERTQPYLPQPAADGPAAAVPPTPWAEALATEHAARSRRFFRTLAGLGVDAAEGLEHAHQLGIVHRDIKPANLMVDLRGNLWVTDFGLAHVHSDSRLTLTGDLVGTLRYMSPEQALGKRVLLDHRTDVYSLGATLYELLTLQPVFEGQDRQDLLRQIAFEEPRPLRRLDPAIPTDLETIVLKALAKTPHERYSTAQELADDLRRYLDDQPIRAKRPTLVQRAQRWARRNRAVVVTAAVGLLVVLLVVAGSFGWGIRDRAARQAKLASDVQAALQEAEALRQQAVTLIGNPYPWQAALAGARSALKRAESLAGPDGAVLDPADRERLQTLRAQLDADERDRQFAARFEELRSLASQVHVGESRFMQRETFPRLRESFEAYGIAFGVTPPDEVAALMHVRPEFIQQQLIAALDVWLYWAPKSAGRDRQWVSDLLCAADADPWRKQVREALAAGDWPVLEKLVPEVSIASQPAAFLLTVAAQLPRELTSMKRTLLRRIQSTYPEDFWANHDYGWALIADRPTRWDEAALYFTAALALRPRNAGVCVNLGLSLAYRGDRDGAIAAYRQAIALNPRYAVAYTNLGNILQEKGDLEEALAALRQAVAVDPGYAKAHYGLGCALMAKGDRERAIAEFRQALCLNPQFAPAHNNLGNALWANGDLEGATAEYQQALSLDPQLAPAHDGLGNVLRARGDIDASIAEHRKAIALDPKSAISQYNLGIALSAKGDKAGALAAHQQAVALDPKYVKAHTILGNALWAKGDHEGAIAAYRRALTLDPKFALAHYNLGHALQARGDVDGAIAAYRQAITFDPAFAMAHNNLGNALLDKGDLDGAMAEYRRAIRIDPQHAMAHGNLASILWTKGDVEGAHAEYRQALAIDPKLVSAHNGLGNTLQSRGDLDGAVAEFRQAIALNPRFAAAHFNLGNVLRDRGDLNGAVEAYRSALGLQPRYAEAHCNLGLVLRLKGQFAEALAEVRQGHEMGSQQSGWRHPSADWIKQCERLIELEPRVPAILSGAARVASPDEQVEFANLCRFKRLHGTAARFYGEAFAAKPELVKSRFHHYRYNAARSAVRASSGQTEDAAQLDDAARSGWQRQALDWLRAELTLWTNKLEKDRSKAAVAVRRALERWRHDPDLAAVRDAPQLAKLTDAERDAWQKLWANVQQTLTRARETAAAAGPRPARGRTDLPAY